MSNLMLVRLGSRQLVLVRHGQQRIYEMSPGDPCPSDSKNGLSKQGVAEATKIAKHLASMKWSGEITVITSPERRCMQTASAIAKSLRTKALPSSRLRDRDYDSAVVSTVEEMRAWQESGWNDPFARAGAAESVLDHSARVAAWVGDVQTAACQTVVLVASATTIEHVNATLLGVPMQAMSTAMIRCNHACYHVWDFVVTPQGRRIAQLVSVNNAATD